MDKELIYIFLPSICWILFSLGGYKYKFFRRFLLPFTIFVFCLIRNIPLYKTLSSTLFLIGALHLGYGETKPYWYKFLVGISYATAISPLGLSFWNFIIPFVFIILFVLSNLKISEKTFTWKICEGFYGLFIGIAVAYVI